MIESWATATALDKSIRSWTSTVGGTVNSTLAGENAVSSRATVAGSNELSENGAHVKTAIKRARVAAGNR